MLLALNIAQHAYYRGVVRYAREHNWHLVMDMMYTGRVPVGWRGDGIITFLGYGAELANFVRASALPKVALTLVHDEIRIPRVECDNPRVGWLAARHFLERGYRNFGWAPFLDDVINAERQAGFVEALGRAGFRCTVLPTAHRLVSATRQENWSKRRDALRKALIALPKPAAVFAYHDCLASDLIDACLDAGVRVPEQVAVLGVDNDPDICDCAAVPLSSIFYDIEEMAYRGAGLLDRLMDGKPAPTDVVRVPPKGVVTRKSTDMRAVENLQVAIALRHIADHYRDARLSVDDVVAATTLPRRALERAFRETVATSIRSELIRVRLGEVRRQLAETKQSVRAIARATGFTRPNHLFRSFRLAQGMSPKEFRRTLNAER